MGYEIEKLFIHYKVDDHFIPMSDFLTASNSVKIIADDLNKKFFNGQLRYQLVIIPPEDGTFLKAIGFMALTLIANAAVVTIASDYMLGVFEEITEHKPSDYGKKHVRALRDLTKGFISKDVEKLGKCIPYELNLDKAFKAKTDLYTSCQNNKQIKAIGFDNSNNFPITRDQFTNHLSKDRIRPLESEFYIADVVLVSPVDIPKDNKWVFQDKVTKERITAYMRDEKFKQDYLSGKYPAKLTEKDDILKVLIEYKKQEKNGVIETKEVCVNTVFSFNDIDITPIPSDLPINTKFQKEYDLPLFGGEL